MSNDRAASASRAVLITGCSTGIGRATATRLVGAGYRVYASARRLDTIADLRALGCETLALDVTDEASMRSAVAAVEKREGAVGVLVNNAGYSQSGAVESIPMESLRRQFETNVFGLARLCQLALPAMRTQRWGRIVNVSSMGGTLTFPGGGAYHATKYAVEALSDALRFEVAGFGIDVVVVQPGLIRTSFGDTAAAAVAATGADAGPYAEFHAMVEKTTKEVYAKGPLALLGGGPDKVAAVIEKAIAAAKPRARYSVTASAKLMMAQRRLLSDGLWDAMLASQFRRPGAA